MNVMIRNIIDLSRGEAVKHGVSVVTELAGPSPVVEGDSVQLQHVLLNLNVNALEAMGSTNRATERIAN
jgi:C4-dicarboxylate-specific signal transduction histidine kinase